MATHAHPYGLWNPWQPEDVARFFSMARVPWWIAGGWAIDLFLGEQTPTGIPYLAPEIQLLYKAKAPRPKDEADFARTLSSLDHERRQWLAQSLAIVHPGHVWLAELM